MEELQKSLINFFSSIYSIVNNKIKTYWPEILQFIAIIILWIIVARWVFLLVLYLFKRFNLIELIDKLQIDVYENENSDIEEKKEKKKISDKIKINVLTAKALSYYIFLLFFRWAIYSIEITQIERFLSDLIWYLPNLFVWIAILFFWIRFASSVYDIVYHTLDLAKQEDSAKIVAIWAKIIILFFTFTFALNYIKVIDDFLFRTFFVGFVSLLSIAWWLAFWLWWKNIAKDLLENLRKK
jgi:hypothetical protein